jgi:DHA2 family methylenomycin A resistance protein-like MFS transporter
VVIVTFAATARYVSDSRAESPRQLDIRGAVAAAITLTAVVFAAINAGNGSLSSTTLGAVAVGVVGLAAFVRIESRAHDPMLPLGLLRSPAFVGANAVAAAMNFVGIGTIFLTTLYLQDVQHRSPLIAGVMLMPLFAPLAVLSPITGRITARHGPRRPVILGLLLGAAGNSGLLLLTPVSPYTDLIPALLGLGAGMGFLTAAVVAAAMRAVSAERAGLASAVNNTARQAAGALGIAVSGAVAGPPTYTTRFVHGLHHIALLGAGLWLAAILVALTTLGSVSEQVRA